MTKRYLVGDVAEVLGVHRNTILGWIKSGKLKRYGAAPKRDLFSRYYFWEESGMKKLKKLTGR